MFSTPGYGHCSFPTSALIKPKSTASRVMENQMKRMAISFWEPRDVELSFLRKEKQEGKGKKTK